MSIYKITLKMPAGERQFDYPSDKTIIEQAEKEGISLPYSCRSGACSSCVAKLTKGEVEQSRNSFLDDELIDKGYILTCCAYPESNCTIETHKEDEINGFENEIWGEGIGTL